MEKSPVPGFFRFILYAAIILIGVYFLNEGLMFSILKITQWFPVVLGWPFGIILIVLYVGLCFSLIEAFMTAVYWLSVFLSKVSPLINWNKYFMLIIAIVNSIFLIFGIWTRKGHYSFWAVVLALLITGFIIQYNYCLYKGAIQRGGNNYPIAQEVDNIPN